ncbi:MAG: AbrB/MazE/SpoVT family DNA-binding domain-containing protein [Mariprofundaceae bacterium]
MNTARLSSKGQLIIPKSIRDQHAWHTGQELEVIDTKEGILLRSKSPFPTTTIDDLTHLKAYSGPTKSLDEMTEAIRTGIKKQRS